MGMFNPERNIDGIIDNGDIDGVGRSRKATDRALEKAVDEVWEYFRDCVDTVSCVEDLRDSNGNTPLHVGIYMSNKEVVEFFVECGADVNAKNNNGCTPLHWACQEADTGIAKYLIEQGADINAKDKKGNTPLHIACQEGNTGIAKYLIEHGADIRAKNKEGELAFGLAAKGHHTEIVQYMIHHLGEKILADVHAKDKEGLASMIQSTPAEKMQGDLSALKDVAKDEQTPEQVARMNEQIGNLSEAVLNNVNSMDVGVKEQDKAVLTQLAGKGYDKAAEELAKLEEQSKTSPLKTTLKGMEEKDEPVSAPTIPSHVSSEEYTRGNDVSISIVNSALMKNKGR